ncbi:PH domain-containing protein [Streptomyces griseoviridis]|uniref:Membrane protein n=3 Tax=Streptomyces TaxID=1883 RepID=A0A918LAB6_STRGD|nr:MULTISPECIES: PH domain-containing protein [Streptomyces]MDP9683739.1 hypothetical protein [Streptomyces griseoviridis]GGS25150.1 membrane protein [Streptomyces niveoruber]
MTTPEHPPPAPRPPAPASQDRIYRSSAGIAGGVLLLAIALWLGIDALVAGEGRTPWLALAALLLVVPLVTAYTLRPAVFADEERLRVRNPLRVVVLPWERVGALRSGYSNEVVADTGAKYQLWAVPVSLRARKRAAQREARRTAADGRKPAGRAGFGLAGRRTAAEADDGPVRAEGDKVMDELRSLLAAREGTSGTAGGEIGVRWAYEIIAPAVAGAVLLAVLAATG